MADGGSYCQHTMYGKDRWGRKQSKVLCNHVCIMKIEDKDLINWQGTASESRNHLLLYLCQHSMLSTEQKLETWPVSFTVDIIAFSMGYWEVNVTGNFQREMGWFPAYFNQASQITFRFLLCSWDLADTANVVQDILMSLWIAAVFKVMLLF